MGLNPHDRRALRSLSEDLTGDPALAGLVSMFTKLTAGQTMPEREQTRPGRPHVHGPVRRPRRHRRRQPSPARVILVWLLLVLAVATGVTAGVLAVAQAHCAAPGVPACAHPSPHQSSRPG